MVRKNTGLKNNKNLVPGQSLSGESYLIKFTNNQTEIYNINYTDEKVVMKFIKFTTSWQMVN